MSSFFTVPASQRKRKREDRVEASASKKRGVDANTIGAGSRRAREREESISGSELDEDEDEIVSGESGDESGSDSDEGETAADRRLKLAERYLENVQEEVDDIGFDAEQIDRDLIAERLKEDVVCDKFVVLIRIVMINSALTGRVQRTDIPTNCFPIILFCGISFVFPLRYPVYHLHCGARAICLHSIER